MKTTQEYINILKSHSAELKTRYGITAMSLFGSVARGEQTDKSDIDIFVDMPCTLKALSGAQNYLSDLLGSDIDLVRNHRFLSPTFLKQVQKDAIIIY